MLVADLAERITFREFTYWKALYMSEPFGITAHYYQAAQVQSAIYNVNRKKGSAPIGIDECVLRFRAPISKETDQNKLLAKIQKSMGALNAIAKRQDKLKDSKANGK